MHKKVHFDGRCQKNFIDGCAFGDQKKGLVDRNTRYNTPHNNMFVFEKTVKVASDSFTSRPQIRIFNVRNFGSFVVGPVKEIKIRIFGEGIMVNDAFVQIVANDEQVFGFVASVELNGESLIFNNRNIKGLGQQGECPICLEGLIDEMFPIQKYDCGHGICTQCVSDLHHCRLKHESQWLYMQCPICRRVLEATGNNADNMYARFFEVRRSLRQNDQCFVGFRAILNCFR